MNISPTSETHVVEALAALAQAQRLRAFRALVVAGTEGLTPSALAALLQIAPSALSFHLKALSHAGLVSAKASVCAPFGPWWSQVPRALRPAP